MAIFFFLLKVLTETIENTLGFYYYNYYYYHHNHIFLAPHPKLWQKNNKIKQTFLYIQDVK